jgi:hypothetical protein
MVIHEKHLNPLRSGQLDQRIDVIGAVAEGGTQIDDTGDRLIIGGKRRGYTHEPKNDGQNKIFEYRNQFIPFMRIRSDELQKISGCQLAF